MLGLDLDGEETVNNNLSTDAQVQGDIQTEESLRLDGRFEGTIECAGTLIVGSNADIQADIFAEKAVIGGTVEGDITARSKIEIRSTGEIHGDLAAPVLHIDRGVVLEGQCTVNTGDAESEDAKVTSIQKKLG